MRKVVQMIAPALTVGDMSKLIPAVLALLIAPTTLLFAQGRVEFGNLDPWPPKYPIWTFGDFDQAKYVGVDYCIQLRWAAGTYSDQASFDAANPAASAFVNFFGTTGGSPRVDGAGVFYGGTISVGPVGPYTMQARGWYNGNLYASYNQSDRKGISVLFTMDVTAPPAAANKTVFPSFVIWYYPVNPPPPQLDIALVNGRAVVSWSVASMPNAVLQSTPTLNAGTWLDVPAPYTIVHYRYTVTNDISGSAKYFRLRYY